MEMVVRFFNRSKNDLYINKILGALTSYRLVVFCAKVIKFKYI